MAARSSVAGLVEIAVDAADEPPDPGDLLLAGGGVGAGPFVDAVDGRGQAFTGAQQVIEIAGEVGQVGRVGAEVVAAGATEPDRAGAAAGCHVGRLGATPVGDGDLTDGVAGVFGVQQGLRVAPDPVAVPVETHRGHRVHGGAAAVLADPVVPAGDVQVAVIKQLGEHIDADAGIGVTLGVGMPVGVGDDLGLVELGAVVGEQRRQRVDPLPDAGSSSCRDGDALRPLRVAPEGGQQLQSADRGVRVAPAGPAAAGR